jgi:hypothetical protein
MHPVYDSESKYCQALQANKKVAPGKMRLKILSDIIAQLDFFTEPPLLELVIDLEGLPR